MGIALGEGACRPASGSLIAEFFGPENRAKVRLIFDIWLYFVQWKEKEKKNNKDMDKDKDNDKGQGKRQGTRTRSLKSSYQFQANGVFSWGVYYGYGLAFIFGIYITQVNFYIRNIFNTSKLLYSEYILHK